MHHRLQHLQAISLSTLLLLFSVGTQIAAIQPSWGEMQSMKSRPSVGRPKTTGGLAGRGLCSNKQMALKEASPIALFPVEGKILAQSPTLWFYIPYNRSEDASNAKKIVVLDLQDSTGNSVDLSGTGDNENVLSLPLPPQQGVIGIRIPSTVKLNRSTSYSWILSIHCKGRDNPAGANNTIEGSFQLGASDSIVEKVRKEKDLRWAVKQYIDADLWLDAVNLIAEKRLINPKDTTTIEEWRKLLSQFDLKQSELDTIVASPILYLTTD